jgi:hypothetical protein
MFENAGYNLEIMLFNQFPISNEEQEMVDKLKNTFPDIEEQGISIPSLSQKEFLN